MAGDVTARAARASQLHTAVGVAQFVETNSSLLVDLSRRRTPSNCRSTDRSVRTGRPVVPHSPINARNDIRDLFRHLRFGDFDLRRG
jgi:hypothetical protein